LGVLGLIRGLDSIFALNALVRCRFLLRPLLVRVQEAFGDASCSICSATDPSTKDMAPSVLASGKALDLPIRIGIVIRKTGTRIPIPSGMICDYAKRRRRRFGKLIHLAAKDDLRLNATILEGVVVKVLEDNGIAGSG